MTDDEIIESISGPHGIAFSQLTAEQRVSLLDAAKENQRLFDIYIDFRKKMDSEINRHVREGIDLKLDAEYQRQLFDAVLGNLDIDTAGHAAVQAKTGASAHVRVLAKEAARRLLGPAGEQMGAIIESIFGNRTE